MSFFKPNQRNEENQLTTQTLADSGKQKQRKIFRRQPIDSHSNDSRRSIHRSSKISLLPSTYVKMERQSEPVGYCLTDRMDYSAGFIGLDKEKEKIHYTPKREVSRKGLVTNTNTNSVFISKVDPTHRRLQHLEEELAIKNKQLELITDDRDSLKKEYSQLQEKYLYLEQLHKHHTSEVDKYKQETKKLTIQKRKLQSERTSLMKKIEFLEKFNFSTQTKTLQSLRQNHLQKQIQVLKQKLKGSVGSVHSILEEEIADQKQEIFSSRKLIESLQINNACLQRKLQENNCFIHQEEDYSTLRNKYKKFLIEYKELRKSFENLQKENQVLRSKQMINSCSEDFSLELSLFSALNS